MSSWEEMVIQLFINFPKSLHRNSNFDGNKDKYFNKLGM